MAFVRSDLSGTLRSRGSDNGALKHGAQCGDRRQLRVEAFEVPELCEVKSDGRWLRLGAGLHLFQKPKDPAVRGGGMFGAGECLKGDPRLFHGTPLAAPGAARPAPVLLLPGDYYATP